MHRVLLLFAMLVMTSAVESIPWHGVVTKTGVLPVDAGQWWCVSANLDDGVTVPVVVMRPDLDHSRIELVVGNGDSPHADRDALALPSTLAVLNAGYFDHDHLPIGWKTIDGIVSGTIDEGLACTGFAWINRAGSLRLTRRGDGAPTDAQWGIQAGPFLIDPGGIHGIHREGGPTARRSMIALTNDGRPLLIAIDHPLTLAAAADLLLALPSMVPLPPLDAALNLDGGPSTSLTIPTAGVNLPARGAVINAWRLVAP